MNELNMLLLYCTLITVVVLLVRRNGVPTIVVAAPVCFICNMTIGFYTICNYKVQNGITTSCYMRIELVQIMAA